jgi:hypothetical protein
MIIRPKNLLFTVIIHTRTYTTFAQTYTANNLYWPNGSPIPLDVTFYGRMGKSSAGCEFKMKVTPAVSSYNGS